MKNVLTIWATVALLTAAGGCPDEPAKPPQADTPTDAPLVDDSSGELPLADGDRRPWDAEADHSGPDPAPPSDTGAEGGPSDGGTGDIDGRVPDDGAPSVDTSDATPSFDTAPGADAVGDTVAPPDCGAWPEWGDDTAGPGDEDFPYGFASGAVRKDSAVVVVPTLGPGSVRVHYTAGPECEPETTPWVQTEGEDGFVAQLQLLGLTPHTVYRYTVELQGGLGQTSYAWLVTAPDTDDPVRLAFSGDIGTSGAYTELYDDIITTGAEALLALGDWPYADLGGAAVSLEEYRDKHREGRTNTGIRDMMRFLPIHSTWDDHEVVNDWDGADTANQPERVAAGMQAWREFFPVRDTPPGEIYRRHAWGPGIDVFWLDLRSHRDANSAPDDGTKTMLGAEQLAWIQQELSLSTAAFKLIMSSVPLDFGTTGNDHWPGFALERDALIAHIVDEGISGVLFLTADQHWLAVHDFPSGIKEFQVGPLAQFLRTPDDNVPPWVLIQQPVRNYGLLDYQPPSAVSPATLTFTAEGDGGEVLWQQTVNAGRGRIDVEASPLTAWRLTGAHTFYGQGSANLEYAVPGAYTVEWLSAPPGTSPAASTTGTLVDGQTLTFTDGSGQTSDPVFTEDFSAGTFGGIWQPLCEGVTDTTAQWEVVNGYAVESGNCYDVQGSEAVIEKRGAWLWNEGINFGDGVVSMDLYHGDDDAMGLAYGIENDQNYYRVSVDIQRSYARLVRVDEGIFTTLDEDLGFAPPEATWNTLVVVRDADTHAIYFNSELILTASDATYTTGSMALYCYGMDDGRFDNIAVFP